MKKKKHRCLVVEVPIPSRVSASSLKEYVAIKLSTGTNFPADPLFRGVHVNTRDMRVVTTEVKVK